jgi:hypothetical protein
MQVVAIHNQAELVFGFAYAPLDPVEERMTCFNTAANAAL